MEVIAWILIVLVLIMCGKCGFKDGLCIEQDGKPKCYKLLDAPKEETQLKETK